MAPADVSRASAAEASRQAGGCASSTYRRSTSSSYSASRATRSSRKSAPPHGTTVADRLPWPSGRVSATASPVSASRSAAIVASTSAPTRSILFAKTRNGIRSRSRMRISTRVCAWTPSTADTTSTAPSSTARARSTSATKSEWPGVSMRLTRVSPTVNATTAERIVMPRARSTASESVTVSPWSTRPTWVLTPVSKRRRSVSVVLPASTCATIPRLMIGELGVHWLDMETGRLGVARMRYRDLSEQLAHLQRSSRPDVGSRRHGR